MATSPPTGTLTFLFTDIEGSTRLWEHDAPAVRRVHSRAFGGREDEARLVESLHAPNSIIGRMRS